VVELRKPQKTPDGVAFEAVGIRGELPPKRDEQLSLFIDSSEWKTDMHVYVSEPTDFCDGQGNLVLSNPDVLSAPQSWSVPPPESFGPVVGTNQIFNAASTNGTTSFSVRYDLQCSGRDRGQVTFNAKVPDNLNSNTFNCPLSNFALKDDQRCVADGGSGYHVTSHAKFQGEDY
jgi:hypothetical protein